MKLRTFSTWAAMFVLAAILALLPGSNGVSAQGSIPAGETISYSGRLSNDAGQPVADGVYAFRFALYDAAEDGNLLWSETQDGVTAKDGAFTALLGSATPLPEQARISNGWLAVSVRGPGETDFTALTPRQQLNAAEPDAPSSPTVTGCPHTHFGEVWKGSSLGTPALAGLRVEDTRAHGTGIMGIATSADSWAIMGHNDNGTGVGGFSDHGFAMYSGGNAEQKLASGGWIKAMARVHGASIPVCYNSQIANPSLANTTPCGFSSSGSGATWTVNFGFKVDDRFISITPYWGSSGTVSAVVKSFPSPNSVTVSLSASSAFYIIIY